MGFWLNSFLSWFNMQQSDSKIDISKVFALRIDPSDASLFTTSPDGEVVYSDENAIGTHFAYPSANNPNNSSYMKLRHISTMDPDKTLYRRLYEVMGDPETVLVLANPREDLGNIKKILGIDPADIKAQKVSLNDIFNGTRYKSFTSNNTENTGESLFVKLQHDINATKQRYRQQGSAVHSIVQNQNSSAIEGLNSDSWEKISDYIGAQIKRLGAKNEGYNRMLHVESSPAQRMLEAFKVVNDAVEPRVLRNHVLMSNLNNEIPFGKHYFEFDEKAAEEAITQAQSNLDKKTAIVTTYEKDILPNYPEMGDDKFLLSAIGVLLKKGVLSKDHGLQNYFKDLNKKKPVVDLHLKMLETRGFAPQEIETVNEDGSITTKYRYKTTKAEWKEDGSRLVYDCYKYIKHCVELVGMQKDFHSLQDDVDKLANNQQEYGRVPTNLTHAGAITGRHTGATGGKFSFNTQGINKDHQNMLVSAKDTKTISVDFSMMELGVAASLLGNKKLLNAYNDGTDIYLAIGLQYVHIQNKNPLDIDELFEKTARIQEASPDYKYSNAKYENNREDLSTLRKLGKMVVLPRLYGSSIDVIAEDLMNNFYKGIKESGRIAEGLCQAFDAIFPELAKTKALITNFVNDYSIATRDTVVYLPMHNTPENAKVVIRPKDYQHYVDLNKERPFIDIGNGETPEELMMIAGICTTADKLQNKQIAHHQHPYDRVFSVNFPETGGKIIYEKIEQQGKTINYYPINSPKGKNFYGGMVLQNICQSAAAEKFNEFVIVIDHALKTAGVDAQYATSVHDDLKFIASEGDLNRAVEVIENAIKGQMPEGSTMKLSSFLNDVSWKYEVAVGDDFKGELSHTRQNTQALLSDTTLYFANDEEIEALFANSVISEKSGEQEVGNDNVKQARPDGSSTSMSFGF